MNNTIQTITIPDLSSSEFASDLNGVFTNINNNFTILANKDFVKGSPGGSVEIREVKFFDDSGNINEYGEKLKECITNYSNSVINDLNGHSVWDNFTPDTAGSLYMIYNIDNSADNSVETPVASLQYIFKDGRFSNSDLGQLSAESIGSEVDLSCVVVYDKSLNNGTGGFKVLNNSISTLYYDENLGFCWKINGVETGLPAQGLPGKNGLDSNIEVAKATKTYVKDDEGNDTGEYYYIVDKLFDSIAGFVDVDNNTNISKYAGRTALVLVESEVETPNENESETPNETPNENESETPNENESEVEVLNETELEVETPNENESETPNETPTRIVTLSNYYFGKFYIDEDENTLRTLRVKLTTTEPINTNVLFTGVTDYMKNIGTDSNFGSAPGLFLPINANDNRTEESVHLMTTAAITVNENDMISGNKNDLLLFPVNNIDEYENDVTVEKYLYVKVNDGNSVVSKYFDNGESFNYVLKYKLDRIENSSFEGDSNLVFGKIETSDDDNNISIIELNEDNTKYIRYDKITSDTHDDSKYSNDHFDSLPSDFYERIFTEDEDNGRVANGIGVYRWVLCTTPNNFDVEDLLLSPSKDANGDYLYSNNINDNGVNEFNVIFGNIFTTSLSPGVSNEFLWFNGCELLDDTNESEVATVDEQDTKYLIPGWHNYKNESVFSFIKFVPVYNNENNRFNEDTALNINYNINVTGNNNDIDYKRNVTVHGSVSCDDLSVFNLTATGEIKNIYTKENIVSDSGIKLGKIDEDEYNCVITSDGINVVDGDIVTNSNISSDSISTNSILAKNRIETNDVKIKSYTTYFAPTISINPDERNIIDIESKNEKINIKIKANTDIKDDETYQDGTVTGTNGNQVPAYKIIDIPNDNEKTVNYSTLSSCLSNNATVIVSNMNIDDTENTNNFCINGALANFKNDDNYVIKPGTGVVRNADFDSKNDQDKGENYYYFNGPANRVKDVDFDTVKNFNIHRVFSKPTVYITNNNSVDVSIDVNEHNNEEIVTFGGDKTLYINKGYNTKAYKASSLVASNMTFDKHADYEHNLSFDYYNDFDTYNFNNILIKNNICNFSIVNSKTPFKNDFGDGFVKQPITIKFNDEYAYICRIGMYAKCNNGRYPVLKDNSRLKLSVYCNINGTYYKLDSLTKECKIDFTTNSITNDNGYEWTGYNIYGNKITNTGGEARYYYFALFPEDIEIPIDTIVTCMDEDETKKTFKLFDNLLTNTDKIDTINDVVKFYVVPDFKLTADGQDTWGFGTNRADCMKVLFVTNLKPIKISEKFNHNCPDITYSNVLNKNSKNYLQLVKYKNKNVDYSVYDYDNDNNVFTKGTDLSYLLYKQHIQNIQNKKDYSNLTYYYKRIKDSKDSTFTSTTLCSDGIVTRHGDYVFGLGFSDEIVNHSGNDGYNKVSVEEGSQDPAWSTTTSRKNIPMLFYYNYDTNMYSNDEPKGNNTDNEKTPMGYSRRLNAIPLDDLFKLIAFIRKSGLTTLDGDTFDKFTI